MNGLWFDLMQIRLYLSKHVDNLTKIYYYQITLKPKKAWSYTLKGILNLPIHLSNSLYHLYHLFEFLLGASYDIPYKKVQNTALLPLVLRSPLLQ